MQKAKDKNQRAKGKTSPEATGVRHKAKSKKAKKRPKC